MPPVDLLRMKEIIKKPLVRCDNQDFCVSKHLAGEYCKCVRTLFPHRTHYELYKQLLDEKAKATLIGCMKKDNE